MKAFVALLYIAVVVLLGKLRAMGDLAVERVKNDVRREQKGPTNMDYCKK